MKQKTHSDILIKNAIVITIDKDRTVFINGAVAVKGSKIIDIGHEKDLIQRVDSNRTIDACGGILHPGFIDAHNHIVGAGCRGVFENDSVDPNTGVNFATWKADVTKEDEVIATKLTSLQLLHNGYTCTVEAGTVFDVEAVAEATKEVGIRMCLADPYIWDTVEIMKHLGSLESSKLFNRAPPNFNHCINNLGSNLYLNEYSDGTLHGYICLYGLGTASDELELRAKEMADKFGVVLHQHEAYEPKSTNHETSRLGKSRISHLANIGVLDKNSTLVHMNTLTTDDLDIIEQFNPSVVWCPSQFLSMGISDKVKCFIPELDNRGVNVTLGSDSARNSSIGDEALTAHLVAMNTGHRLSPEKILEMQTINAARSAGLDAITGSLTVGKRADFVVTNPYSPDAYPGVNPVQQLALTNRAGHAWIVVVNGKIVLENGTSTMVDEKEIFKKANISINKRIDRLGLSTAMRWPVLN